MAPPRDSNRLLGLSDSTTGWGVVEVVFQLRSWIQEAVAGQHKNKAWYGMISEMPSVLLGIP